MAFIDLKTKKTNYRRVSRRLESSQRVVEGSLDAAVSLFAEVTHEAEKNPDRGYTVTIEQVNGRLLVRAYLRKNRADLSGAASLLKGVHLPLKLVPEIVSYAILLIKKGIFFLGLFPAVNLYTHFFKKPVDLSDFTHLLEEMRELPEDKTVPLESTVSTKKTRVKKVSLPDKSSVSGT